MNHFTKAKTAHQTYTAAMLQATTHHDGNLSTAGLAEARNQRAKQVREAHAQQVATLKADLANQANAASANLKAAMPSPAGSTADSWARVRMLLDAGHTLHSVISRADVPTLQAIREWGPTYLDSQSPMPSGTNGANWKPTDVAPLLSSVARRWAQVDPEAAPAIAHHFTLSADAEQARIVLDDLSTRVAGRIPAASPLETIIRARMAGSHAVSDLSTTEPTEHAESDGAL